MNNRLEEVSEMADDAGDNVQMVQRTPDGQRNTAGGKRDEFDVVQTDTAKEADLASQENVLRMEDVTGQTLTGDRVKEMLAEAEQHDRQLVLTGVDKSQIDLMEEIRSDHSDRFNYVLEDETAGVAADVTAEDEEEDQTPQAGADPYQDDTPAGMKPLAA